MRDPFKHLFSPTSFSSLGDDFAMSEIEIDGYCEQYLPEIGFRSAKPRRPSTRAHRSAHRL